MVYIAIQDSHEVQGTQLSNTCLNEEEAESYCILFIMLACL